MADGESPFVNRHSRSGKSPATRYRVTVTRSVTYGRRLRRCLLRSTGRCELRGTLTRRVLCRTAFRPGPRLEGDFAGRFVFFMVFKPLEKTS